jgi:hypothetical protein
LRLVVECGYLRIDIEPNNSQIHTPMKKTSLILFGTLIMLPALLSAQIITNPDSVTVYPGDTILVDVLINDYEITNDSIFVFAVSDTSVDIIGNRYLRVALNSSWLAAPTGRIDTITYTVHQVNGSHVAHGYLYIDYVNNTYNVLDINNLSARFNAMGNHFWDLQWSSAFFAPKSTVKSPLFNSTFWIGGKESTTGQLHLSAERFRQVGVDYHAGPVSTLYDSLYNRRWSRMWKLSTDDILYHMANYNSPNYTPISDIAEWPAHGDTTLGQLWNMAPFHDSNNNGIYEPMAGDYPLIRGNMALFFVFNDVRSPNTESGGTPLGIEVHGMAYAFNQPTNPLLFNTIFMHYDIINRSANQYDSTWIGIFNDFDLGWSYDDFIGTHVKHGAVYAYNGTAVDGSGQSWAYGANPPVMAMQLLGGPFMDPDGLDNPKTDLYGNPLCDVSLNGLNFGDGIADNERLGLTHSMAFYNPGMSPWFMTDPGTSFEYYNYMRCIWRDFSRQLYGGTGHAAGGAYGPEANFAFPGDSDSCHFGLGGVPPNGPTLWTEITACNQPYDRRILASSGPFTFNPGERHQLDVAWIFAYDLVHNAPFDTLVDWMGKLKDLFQGSPTMFDPAVSVVSRTTPAKSYMLLYPNPARERITINGLNTTETFLYQIFGLTGQIVASGTVVNGESLTVAHLTPGLYIIRLQAGNEVISRKFVRE